MTTISVKNSLSTNIQIAAQDNRISPQELAEIREAVVSQSKNRRQALATTTDLLDKAERQVNKLVNMYGSGPKAPSPCANGETPACKEFQAKYMEAWWQGVVAQTLKLSFTDAFPVLPAKQP